MFLTKTSKLISIKNIDSDIFVFLILNKISEKKMAAIDNLTAILYKVDDIRLEQVPVPEPSADQVKYQLIR